MRARTSRDHAELLARRLEQLTAELHVDAPASPVQVPSPGAPVAGPSEPGATPVPVEEHTRVRRAPGAAAQPVASPLVARTPYDEPVPGGSEPQALPAAGAPELPRPGRHAAPRRRQVDLAPVSGRVHLEPPHVALAAVVAAVALAVTCWWVLRDDAGEPLAPPAPARPLHTTPAAAPPAPAAGSSDTAADAEVVVDVAGKVRRPGVVVLAAGSRVVDALDAAGGATKGADLTSLNLARVLTDGEQVVVGLPPVPGVAASSATAPPPPGATAGGLVNLNLATLADLDSLPGIGPVTAQAILDWREANGGFSSVDQLLEVKGIGEATLADLAPLVTL